MEGIKMYIVFAVLVVIDFKLPPSTKIRGTKTTLFPVAKTTHKFKDADLLR